MVEFYAGYISVLMVMLGAVGVGGCVVGFISDFLRSGDEDRQGGPR